MRGSRLLIVLSALCILAAPAGGASPPDPAGTVWSGIRTVRLNAPKRKRAPKIRLEEDLTAGFDVAENDAWRLDTGIKNPLFGTLLRKRSRGKLEIFPDSPTEAEVLGLIEQSILDEVGAAEVVASVRKQNARARIRKPAGVAARLKLTWKIAFEAIVDGEVRRGTWRLRYDADDRTEPDPDPDPTDPPLLVGQEQFRVVLATMADPRSSHTSTLLPGGKVLLAGGFASGLTINRNAELFDPEDESFTRTATPLEFARASHTATALPNGKVLLAGGEETGGGGLASVELYDPANDGFELGSPMSTERFFHTATALPKGRVLVTGGRTVDAQGFTVFHRSAEVYDPASGDWSATANDMDMLRAGHRATRMENGLVLITGGSGNKVAELFDPATNRFRTIDARMLHVRSLHGSVEMPTGVVLLSDGGALPGEFYEPKTETFLLTGNSAGRPRSAALHLHISPGNVLIWGGIDFGASFLHASVSQFLLEYASGPRYFMIPALPGHGVYLRENRAFSAVSRLADGRFLVTGGIGEDFLFPDVDTAVIFTPAE